MAGLGNINLRIVYYGASIAVAATGLLMYRNHIKSVNDYTAFMKSGWDVERRGLQLPYTAHIETLSGDKHMVRPGGEKL